MLWSFELAGWPIRGISLKPKHPLYGEPTNDPQICLRIYSWGGPYFFSKTLINAQNLAILGGGFRWGNDPIWRAYFSDELVQPPTRIGILTLMKSLDPPRQILSAILLVPWRKSLSNGWGSGLFSTSAGRRRFTGSVFTVFASAFPQVKWYNFAISQLVGGLKYFLFSPLLGEDSHFD